MSRSRATIISGKNAARATQNRFLIRVSLSRFMKVPLGLARPRGRWPAQIHRGFRPVCRNIPENPLTPNPSPRSGGEGREASRLRGGGRVGVVPARLGLAGQRLFPDEQDDELRPGV